MSKIRKTSNLRSSGRPLEENYSRSHGYKYIEDKSIGTDGEIKIVKYKNEWLLGKGGFAKWYKFVKQKQINSNKSFTDFDLKNVNPPNSSSYSY